jgi:hypothetical protein
VLSNVAADNREIPDKPNEFLAGRGVHLRCFG